MNIQEQKLMHFLFYLNHLSINMEKRKCISWFFRDFLDNIDGK